LSYVKKNIFLKFLVNNISDVFVFRVFVFLIILDV
jgi:hypothetical protein